MKVLGIDIGGSAVKGAVVETNTGELLTERRRIKTSQPSKPHEVAGIVDEIIRHFEWNGEIGCGFPAVIQNGIAKTASNIDKSWIGVSIPELFKKSSNFSVNVLNDADAAGLAEMKFGAGKQHKGVVVIITIGTGLGSALFSKRKLFPNTEFGHFILNGQIAEKYASDLTRKKLDLSWKKWGSRFNEYLSHLEMLLNPDMFILGGGASKKCEKFQEYLNVQTEIVSAGLGNEAGIIGAAISTEILESRD
jgi:polyphosphate glucokinase